MTDEAMNGCGLVVLTEAWVQVGAECMVKVGGLGPLKAQIRWVRDLGEGVRKLGVEFLE